jgi:hypothetical protein
MKRACHPIAFGRIGGGIIGPGGIGGIGAPFCGGICGLYIFWFSIIVLCFAVSDFLYNKNIKNKIKIYKTFFMLTPLFPNSLNR